VCGTASKPTGADTHVALLVVENKDRASAIRALSEKFLPHFVCARAKGLQKATTRHRTLYRVAHNDDKEQTVWKIPTAIERGL
jgi:hypothetical protein